jgi:hypothetical protein
VVHLAKALAAFGRAGGAGAGVLGAKIKELTVTDDTEYWILDGCVWAVGYLGGLDAAKVITDLEMETPSRAVRSQSVYQGSLSKEQRAEKYAAALAGARALIEGPDPGGWREKRTTLTQQKKKSPPAKKTPWNVR